MGLNDSDTVFFKVIAISPDGFLPPGPSGPPGSGESGSCGGPRRFQGKADRLQNHQELMVDVFHRTEAPGRIDGTIGAEEFFQIRPLNPAFSHIAGQEVPALGVFVTARYRNPGGGGVQGNDGIGYPVALPFAFQCQVDIGWEFLAAIHAGATGLVDTVNGPRAFLRQDLQILLRPSGQGPLVDGVGHTPLQRPCTCSGRNTSFDLPKL